MPNLAGFSAKIERLEEFDAKFRSFPASLQTAIVEANRQNALEFAKQVAQIVPVGDDEKRHGERLASTLNVEQKQAGAFVVSIGGPEAPYAAHVEFGHNLKGGKHVPPKPYWFPSLRILKRRFAERVTRAANKAIKALGDVGS